MDQMLDYLERCKDMAWNNRFCYSKTYAMTSPRLGYEKEFEEAVRDCELVDELIAMVSRKANIDENSPSESEYEKLITLAQAILSGMVHIFVNRDSTTLNVSVVGGIDSSKLCTLSIQDKLSHYRVQGYQLF